MTNNLLISLLKTELVEREQEATRLRKLASEAEAKATRLESLAANLREILQEIETQENQEYQDLALILDQSCQDEVKYLPTESLNAAQYIDKTLSVNGNGANAVITQQEQARTPKEYQRPEYQHLRGYVEIARRILEKHPEGLHIGQLIQMIFDYQSVDEFVKAKRSLQTELIRGIKENRLLKNGDYYFFSK